MVLATATASVTPTVLGVACAWMLLDFHSESKKPVEAGASLVVDDLALVLVFFALKPDTVVLAVGVRTAAFE